MNRAIDAFLSLISLCIAAPAVAGDDWTTWVLDDQPAAWRLQLDGPAADFRFAGGLSVGGVEVGLIEIHPQGVVSLGAALPRGVQTTPRPLRQLVEPGVIVVAPFWAELADRACPDSPVGDAAPTVRWRFDGALTIEWHALPRADCDASKGTVSVALRLEAGGGTMFTFSYADVGAPGGFQPRAGVVAGPHVLELFPDGSGVPDRAKALSDGGSERQRFRPDEVGVPADGVSRSQRPRSSGVWTIELDADGRVVGDDDADGVRGNDNCGALANPLQLDLDRDGDGDACDRDLDGDRALNPADNCPRAPNPEQSDLDSDGRGDACDGDRDGDGWTNGFDLCPDIWDRARLDTDGDGVGDACDADIDGDDDAAALNGGPVLDDLCPFLFDPARKDRDGDGIGDVCDRAPGVPCKGTTCIDQRDADGDGHPNLFDACPTVADPDQADADRDGRGDACDPDRDGDGWLDLLEPPVTGTNRRLGGRAADVDGFGR